MRKLVVAGLVLGGLALGWCIDRANSATGVTLPVVLTPASTATGTGFNIAPGVAPSAPNNGDVWTTSSGLFARINGATSQLAATSGSSFLGVTNFVTGTTTPQNIAGAVALTQVNGVTPAASTISIGEWSNDALSPFARFFKSRGAAIGTKAAVNSLDPAGEVSFSVDDGSTTGGINIADIYVEENGAVSAGVAAGDMKFFTKTGAGMLTSQMEIFADGGIIIGAPSGTDEGVGTLNVAGAYYANGTIGVNCSGTPSSSFASVNGIVTHC